MQVCRSLFIRKFDVSNVGAAAMADNGFAQNTHPVLFLKENMANGHKEQLQVRQLYSHNCTG